MVTVIYSNRVSQAFAYALQLHRHQERKGSTIPYITHLMAVAAIVGEYGGDEELVIAGLLHDAVEDQGGQDRLKEIRFTFGDRVARVVEGCSDTDVVPKPPWKERKDAYLAHLKDADPDTLLVSAADKLHNARAIAADLRQIGNALWQRFTGTKDQSLWYYRTLADTYSVTGNSDIAREVDLVVRQIEELASQTEC
jgi:(p)ppGpp synthase/HD superfamily hydrolase